MTRADIVAYCLGKPGAWLDEPWEGDEVAKVADKIFVFIGNAETDAIGVKCGRDADEAGELRARYPRDVTASAYVGRHGWNRVRIEGSVPDDEIRELIDASYDAVVAGLPRTKRP